MNDKTTKIQMIDTELDKLTIRRIIDESYPGHPNCSDSIYDDTVLVTMLAGI